MQTEAEKKEQLFTETLKQKNIRECTNPTLYVLYSKDNQL